MAFVRIVDNSVTERVLYVEVEWTAPPVETKTIEMEMKERS